MPPPTGDFVAMSVFFYALHCLHELGPTRLEAWPKPSLRELREAAQDFCAMDWEDMMHEDDAMGKARASHKFTGSVEALAHRCVETVYVTTLLRDGYGFPDHSRNVTYALKSNGMEVEWTLGFALVELARRQGAGAGDLDTGRDGEVDVEIARIAAVDVEGDVVRGGGHGANGAKSPSSPGFEHCPNDGAPDDNHTDSAAMFVSPCSGGRAKRGNKRKRCGDRGDGGDRSPSPMMSLWCDARGTCCLEGSSLTGPSLDDGHGDEAGSFGRSSAADHPSCEPELKSVNNLEEASLKASSAVAPLEGAVHGEECDMENAKGAAGNPVGLKGAATDVVNVVTLLAVRGSMWWDYLRGARVSAAGVSTSKGCDYSHLEKVNQWDLWALVQGWTTEAAKWTGLSILATNED